MSPAAGRCLAILALALVTSASVAAVAPGDKEIAGVFSEFVKPGEPGCTVGVVQSGALTHAEAFGLADLERAKPLDTHSTFDLASVSKQFTAFALLLLQQQGKLSLDDPIVKYLPELAASAKGVTLRHLLHHTGGLRDYIALIMMRGRSTSDGSTIHESVQALARQTRPNAEPGVEYEYSNTGYLLLGVVIARVSGQSLAEFSEERIFRPLGMKNTRIVDRYPSGIATFARGYSNTEKGFVIDENSWEQVGDGGVLSDLHDLALWDENFYTAKLGGRALVDGMYEAGLLNSGKSTGYAAGLAVDDKRGLRWVTHGGSWVGYRSNISRIPSEHFSVIVLCNRADAAAGSLASSVAEIFLKDKLGPPEPEEEEEEKEAALTVAEWQPGELARYAGAYYSAEAVAQCRLYLRDGKLVVEGCAEGAELKPGKAGEFTDEDESFTLRFPENGNGTESFTYDTFGLRELPFTRVTEPVK